jgi:hypothetical protein
MPLGDKGLRHIVIAVKVCWNWAADSIEDGGGLLAADCRPLRKLQRGFVKPKDRSEEELPTPRDKHLNPLGGCRSVNCN